MSHDMIITNDNPYFCLFAHYGIEQGTCRLTAIDIITSYISPTVAAADVIIQSNNQYTRLLVFIQYSGNPFVIYRINNQGGYLSPHLCQNCQLFFWIIAFQRMHLQLCAIYLVFLSCSL